MPNTPFQLYEESGSHTMIDLLLTMVFLLMLIVMSSVVEPEEVSAGDPIEQNEVIEWQRVSLLSATKFSYSGREYSSLQALASALDRDKPVAVMASTINSKDLFHVLQGLIALKFNVSLAE